jgi:hypothetical protein
MDMQRLKTEIEEGLARFVANAKAASAGRLAGCALCTDDSLSTLFAVACDSEWIENGPEDRDRWVPTEWQQSEAADELAAARALLVAHAAAAADFDRFVDAAFATLVSALQSLRDAEAVDSDVLLVALSTDPGPKLEALMLSSVDQLNTTEVALNWRRELGY